MLPNERGVKNTTNIASGLNRPFNLVPGQGRYCLRVFDALCVSSCRRHDRRLGVIAHKK